MIMPLKNDYTCCACCGKALAMFEQQVIRLHLLVTCENAECPMFGLTDAPMSHLQNATEKRLLRTGCFRPHTFTEVAGTRSPL
jgi:hypothetical protein